MGAGVVRPGGLGEKHAGRALTGALARMDPSHVTVLATDALDVVRRDVWNAARRRKDQTGARWLKGARFALWKAPERLTGRQRATLATIRRTSRRPYRAYLLKRSLSSRMRRRAFEFSERPPRCRAG